MSGPVDIREFVEYHDITAESEWTPVQRWDWGQGSNTWKVKLSRPRARGKAATMTVPKFTTGSALQFGDGGVDDAVMVMESLQMDAHTAEAYDYPQELADDYGMDWFDRDERLKAINIFRGCNSEKRKLEKFLGDDLYEEFLELEE